ncbi:MAG: response regulator transcription factor [Rubricoccaceae bacterium]|nr:response regulator transcription factor [Rubricoccaceae bacterium]
MAHRIFLVEDHPVMQEGYARLLNREADFELCGQAESGTDALQAIPAADPDLAIVDLSIPGMNGLDLLKQLRVITPELPCLVVTAHSEALYAERALRAGARGFLNKDAPPSEVVTAVRTVLRGERYLSPELRERLAQQSGSNDAPPSPLEVLSDRELEVFEHFGRGLSTTQTADALFISPKTVETHRANIKRKLGLDRANEVIQRATLWVESLDTSD